MAEREPKVGQAGQKEMDTGILEGCWEMMSAAVQRIWGPGGALGAHIVDAHYLAGVTKVKHHTSCSCWCEGCFAADVGHVCRRDSEASSRSRGRARGRERKADVSHQW
jgi:hypothetical protein